MPTFDRMVKARRAHSMPTRHVMPSEEMGEYEEERRRSIRPAGMLFPLREEGTYGAPPPGPPPPPIPYKGRERKPKIYSSYAVDHECSVHSKKLADLEKDHGNEHIARPPRKSFSRSSSAGRQAYYPSTSSSRGQSTERQRVSSSPEPFTRYGAQKKMPGQSWTSSTVSNQQRYMDDDNNTGYQFNNRRDARYEENEEYEYEENRTTTSRRTKGNVGFGNSDFDSGDISLDGLRRPTISSWDSMGILGLSNKMWRDTKKRQESFMQSTAGHFMRQDEAIDSYIM